MLDYWLARISSFLLRRLPPRVGYRLSYLVGDIVYLTWPRVRHSARQNMAQVFRGRASRGEIQKAARRTVRNYCKNSVDMARLSRVKPEELSRRIQFRGWENIDRALERGRGAILVSLHLGPWDLAGAAIALRHPLNAVADAIGQDRLNRFIQNLRRSLGMSIIPPEPGAMQRMLQALRRNELLGLFIDRPRPRRGVAVSFLNGPTQLSAGVATLALRTGAQVLPFGLVRLPDNTFLGFVDPHIPFQPSGNFIEDVQALTQRIVTSLEYLVRQYPDQWHMFRPLWPPGPSLTEPIEGQ